MGWPDRGDDPGGATFFYVFLSRQCCMLLNTIYRRVSRRALTHAFILSVQSCSPPSCVDDLSLLVQLLVHACMQALAHIHIYRSALINTVYSA